MIFIIIFIVIIWWVLGVAGFIFWWIKEFDLTNEEILIAMLVGVLGPLSWAFGFMVHRDNKILMKKRK